MGGEVTKAVRELHDDYGIPIISLNMAGSVPDVCDLIVSDPVQAGVMAVMHVAETAKFDLRKVAQKKF
jgi:energy-converting hydrogenase B subunit Q